MALLKSLWCLLACLAVVSCNTTSMEITMATTSTTPIASTPAVSATATTTTGAVVPGPAATTTTSAQGAATATATPAQGAATTTTPGQGAATTTTPGQGAAATTTAAAAMSSMPFVINPTATSAPAASSSVIAAACVPSNQTSCVASKCCLGNSGAWSGVDKTKKLPYNETTCPPSGQLLVAREKTCVEVCVNKECDGSGANGLMIQGTTLLLSLFAFWVITYD